MLFHQRTNTCGEFSYNVLIHENRDFCDHFHRGCELLYVLEGQIEMTRDNRSVILKEGDFAIFLSNEAHRLHSIGSTRLWICVFAPEYIPEFDRAVQGKIGKDNRIYCSASEMAFMREQVLLPPEKLDSYKLTAGLYLMCSAYLNQVELVQRNKQEYAMMNRIADCISSRFREDIDLQQVASLLGYDYHYISRRFQQIFRLSFREYLNSFRLAAAMEALRSTSHTISQIAMSSGFQSIRNFNAVFQEKVGMTPTQYRENVQHNKPTEKRS